MSPHPTPLGSVPHCCLQPPGHHCPLWLLEDSSSTAITCLGPARGHQGIPSFCSEGAASVRAAGNCRGQHSLASLSHPLCPHKHCWAVEEAMVQSQHQQLPIPEQPEASGLPRGLLLSWSLKCQPCGISAVSFKWETNLSCDLGKDNQSRRGLHPLPKQGLPAAKAFDSPAPPCFLQRESANLALTFTEISEFSIQGRKGRW